MDVYEHAGPEIDTEPEHFKMCNANDFWLSWWMINLLLNAENYFMNTYEKLALKFRILR